MESVQRTLQQAGAETYLQSGALSINKVGDIVTLGQVEYRWRDGEIFQRAGSGDLIKTQWNHVPQAVRDALCERIPA